MSNLTRTLAVLSLLAPAGAYPLGIGEIKLHSALNQNLDAEIALMLSPGERISDVKVSLAPPDKFDERGVPWSYFLSNISFEPTVRADGSPVIRVRSREALKEPILDLLLQVTWPKGTSYRQFSLMIDPPAAYAQPTVPVMRMPEVAAGEAPAPLSPSPSSAPEPGPIAAKPSARPPRQDAIVNGVYGPTRKNDTLWGIAEKASRQYKVSIEQMMVAVYKENPGAFYQENVHALSTKAKLKIPDREAIVKLSRDEAVAEFNRQTEAWKNHAHPVDSHVAETAGAVLKKPEPVEEKSVENQLTLAAPAEATVGEKAVITPGQEQNASADSVKTEAGAANIKANEEMLERMAALEQQLAKMQALLTIKEQQLAALQNQAQQPPKPETVPSSAVTPQAAEAPPAGMPQERSPQATPAQQPEHISPDQQAVAEQTEKAPAVQPQPAKPAGAEKKPAVRSLPVAEQDADALPLGWIGGAGAAVASLLGFFWWRRRKSKSESESQATLNTESMFSPSIIYKAPETESSFSVPALNENTAYDVAQVGESSFLSEFTPSDFEALDTDQGEIDPISEADVYLAYGRYQQAEELMRHAIESDPSRDECKLKLLEIYYAGENRAAFEAYAKELVAAGKNKDSAFWEKMVEMGREVCPDSPLFLSGTQTKAEVQIASEPEPVRFAKEPVSSPESFDMSFGTDFDPTAFGMQPDENLESAQAAVADDGFADLDLTGFSLDDAVDPDELRNHESIDFDLDKLPALGLESESQVSGEDLSALQSLPEKNDFDIESFAFDTGFSDNSTIRQEAVNPAPDQLDLTKEPADDRQDNALDFDFDFDFSTFGDDEAEEDRIDMDGVSDLTDMDELETKLDLARAYRDMGDNESAKDIVAEVLEKGSVEQKKLAQVLLGELT